MNTSIHTPFARVFDHHRTSGEVFARGLFEAIFWRYMSDEERQAFDAGDRVTLEGGASVEKVVV